MQQDNVIKQLRALDIITQSTSTIKQSLYIIKSELNKFNKSDEFNKELEDILDDIYDIDYTILKLYGYTHKTEIELRNKLVNLENFSSVINKVTKKEDKLHEEVKEHNKKIDKDIKEAEECLKQVKKDKEKKKKDKKKKEYDIIGKSDVTYADSVNFSEVDNIAIESSVVTYPISCRLYIKSICYADIEITGTNSVVIKKDSIICKSNNSAIAKIDSKEAMNKRIKALEEGKLENKYIPGYNMYKYVLKEDILLSTLASAKKFILGRSLNKKDEKLDFMVGDISLENYLVTGDTSQSK